MTTIADLTARQLHQLQALRRQLRAYIDLETDDGPIRVQLHGVDVASWRDDALWVTYYLFGQVGRARVSVDTDVEVRL